MRLKPYLRLPLLTLIFAPLALAQVAPPISSPSVPGDANAKLLDTVVVSGSAPGPGMWHVYYGDNDMWILGTLSPLPAGITWNTDVLRGAVSGAQEVLWEPYYTVDVKSGFFQKLSLGYNMTKAGKNPDGKTLQQVLSPEIYARWARLKARYLPKDRAVDAKRPLMAAEDLFRAATAAHGLSNRRIWAQPLRDATAAAGAKSTAPNIVVSLDAAKAKALLQDAKNTSFNDAACMNATLDAIEQDLPRMITNANAWATGDLERINFAQIQRRDRACSDVFSNNEVSRKYGLPNISLSIQNRFMQEAEAALKRNRTTVAVVPLENMLGPNGYAAKLRAKGYEVSNP